MTPNGSPSWKVIAYALGGLVLLALGALVSNADSLGADNARQEREIVEVKTDVSNLKQQLNRIEAKLDRAIERTEN